MAKKNLITKVAECFEILGYKVWKQPDIYEFFDVSAETLFKSATMQDIISRLSSISFCFRNWRKIMSPKIAAQLKEHGSEDYILPFSAQRSTKPPFYTAVYTTMLSRKDREIHVFTDSQEEDFMFLVNKRQETYRFVGEGHYYLSKSAISANRYKIFNYSDEKMCEVYYKKGAFVLAGNKTLFDIFQDPIYDNITITHMHTGDICAEIFYGFSPENIGLTASRLVIYNQAALDGFDFLSMLCIAFMALAKENFSEVYAIKQKQPPMPAEHILARAESAGGFIQDMLYEDEQGITNEQIS